MGKKGRIKKRAKQFESSTTSRMEDNEDECPQQVPGSSVLFTPGMKSLSSRRQLPSKRAGHMTTAASVSKSNVHCVSSSSASDRPCSSKRRGDTQGTKTQNICGHSSGHSFQDSESGSASTNKKPRTDNSEFGFTCRRHGRRRPLESRSSQQKKKTHKQPPRKGDKHCARFQASSSSKPESCTDSYKERQPAQDCSKSTSSPLDIPGFYYDPEKQKYFKILPTTGNINVVTKETIARDKAEAKRRRDLKSFCSISSTRSATQTSTSTAAPTLSARKQKTCQSVDQLLLGAYQRGEVYPTRLQKMFSRQSASGLRPTGSVGVFKEPHALYEKLEHMQQMETSRDHDKILCLWSIRGSVIQRLQLVTLREPPRDCPGCPSLAFDPSGTTVMQSWSKITSVCWADFPQYPGKKYVLYTTMCHTGQAYSLAFIRNLDPGYRDDVHLSDFNLGTRATWVCAWNLHRQQFSVGTEKGCIVIDVGTRRLWQFKTYNSDALAQIFSKEDGGSLMYTGTRRGQILLHDLRSSSTFPTVLMSHKSSLGCLRLSSDEMYLYASDFSGKINKWDLRMRKTVISYDGLFNQYTKLPFHIDETESILYGAGQDCYSKVWNLDSAKLLLSIPPPCQASRDTIPAIQFSTRWAGSPGNAGLLMGVRDRLFLYGSRQEKVEENSCGL